MNRIVKKLISALLISAMAVGMFGSVAAFAWDYGNCDITAYFDDERHIGYFVNDADYLSSVLSDGEFRIEYMIPESNEYDDFAYPEKVLDSSTLTVHNGFGKFTLSSSSDVGTLVETTYAGEEIWEQMKAKLETDGLNYVAQTLDAIWRVYDDEHENTFDIPAPSPIIRYKKNDEGAAYPITELLQPSVTYMYGDGEDYMHISHGGTHTYTENGVVVAATYSIKISKEQGDIQFPVKLSAKSVTTGEVVSKATIEKKDVSSSGDEYTWETTYEFTKNLPKDEPVYCYATDNKGMRSTKMIRIFPLDSKKSDSSKPTPTPTVKEPTISKSVLELVKGKAATLSVKNKPKKTTVEWTSSDDTIAAVSKKGKVTPKKTGTATITATLLDKDKAAIGTYTCAVSVEKPSVSANKIALTMETKESATAVLLDTLEGSTPVTGWKSSKKSVAEVDSDTGVITAKKAGVAIISVKRNGKTYKVKVNVYDPYINPKKDVVTIKKGRTKKLSIKKGISGVANTVWSSDNTEVVTVDNKGKITAVSVGTATISATNAGKTVTRVIEVTE